MILLRRLSGPLFTLNPDLIERAEATPDTVVTLIGGNKYVISESLEELVELIRDYRARIIAAAETMMIDSGYASEPQPAPHTTRMRVLTTPPSQPVVPLRRSDS
ncbi:MAG: flagellar FlbD family protein [Jatrophihabitantaceae bacterium]